MIGVGRGYCQDCKHLLRLASDALMGRCLARGGEVQIVYGTCADKHEPAIVGDRWSRFGKLRSKVESAASRGSTDGRSG